MEIADAEFGAAAAIDDTSARPASGRLKEA
jgi:hypothetical protein